MKTVGNLRRASTKSGPIDNARSGPASPFASAAESAAEPAAQSVSESAAESAAQSVSEPAAKSAAEAFSNIFRAVHSHHLPIKCACEGLFALIPDYKGCSCFEQSLSHTHTHTQ